MFCTTSIYSLNFKKIEHYLILSNLLCKVIYCFYTLQILSFLHSKRRNVLFLSLFLSDPSEMERMKFDAFSFVKFTLEFHPER